MRRSSLITTNRRRKAFVYSAALIAMLAYGIPKLPKVQHGLPGTFSFLWILFACLALGANLYFVVGADKERSRMLSAKRSGVVMTSPESDEQEVRRRAL